MTTDHTFFQHGDEPDAANFAQAFGIAVRTSCLLSGFAFTADLGELELDVDAGVAAVWRGDFETASPNIDPSETRSGTAHAIEKEALDGLALENDVVNHVFLDADVGTSSNPTIVVNTSGDAPSNESVKIGEVDTNEADASDATSERWWLVTADGTLTFPNSDAAEAAADELVDGSIVFDRTESRHYRVDDNKLERLGRDPVLDVVGSPERLPIAELDDDESIEIPIVVEDGKTFEVYRWGAYDVDDGDAPTGLDVELLDGDDTVQEAENTTNTQDTDNPVAWHQNTSGSSSIFKLRAKNDTGDAIDDPGVGSHFGFQVV